MKKSKLQAELVELKKDMSDMSEFPSDYVDIIDLDAYRRILADNASDLRNNADVDAVSDWLSDVRNVHFAAIVYSNSMDDDAVVIQLLSKRNTDNLSVLTFDDDKISKMFEKMSEIIPESEKSDGAMESMELGINPALPYEDDDELWNKLRIC